MTGFLRKRAVTRKQIIQALCVFFCLQVAMHLSLTVTHATQEKDLLDLKSGAVVLSATTHYGGKWNALALLDGTTLTGWTSSKDNLYSDTFVIELARQYLLTSFVVDNTGADESNFPGISAHEFELYVSTTSSREGFSLVLSGKAEQFRRRVFELDNPVEARWLKLIVLSNWGNPSHTELMELEAYGEPVGEPPPQKPVRGIYSTNYGPLLLNQCGKLVKGCYDLDNGRLSGINTGRVLNFQWWEDGPDSGTALMVLSSDGRFLNGLWYRNGLAKGVWYGRRETEHRKPECEAMIEGFLAQTCDESGSEESVEETVATESLREISPTSLHKIYFDVDSSVLKPEFENKLKENLAVLEDSPSERIVIEGHADSTHTEEYNMELSKRRARAVMQWFIEEGVAANRLETRHYGESQPVADNSAAAGRALNRRVEIVLQ